MTTKSDTGKLKQLLKETAAPIKLLSIRFRSVALSRATKDHTMRRVAIHNERDGVHADCDIVNAYAVFADKQAVQDCQQKLNGSVFMDRHLRCDRADAKKSFENSRTVFVGNLPLSVTEESLWQHF